MVNLEGAWIDWAFAEGKGLYIFRSIATDAETAEKIVGAIEALAELPEENESVGINVKLTRTTENYSGRKRTEQFSSVRLGHHPPGSFGYVANCCFVVRW